MNDLGLKSINYSKHVMELILLKEEKFEYIQAIFNMELSIARIYSKLYDKEKSVQVKYLT